MTYNDGKTESKQRRWPGLVVLLALIVAGVVLLLCGILLPWLLR